MVNFIHISICGGSKRNALALALQRYGRLPKTLHILEWCAEERLRRRVCAMLNKGEALHTLRDYVRHANHGVIRQGGDESLLNEASSLNLIVNAIIIWNTTYMQATIDQLRLEGFPVKDEDLPHLWPTRYEHINVHGKVRFLGSGSSGLSECHQSSLQICIRFLRARFGSVATGGPVHARTPLTFPCQGYRGQPCENLR